MTATQAGAGRLRIGYVYRSFNRSGSLASVFLDRAERLARDEDVIAFCSASGRETTAAPLRFEDVEPLVRGTGRGAYALECASFAVRADRAVARLRSRLDVVHVSGFAATEADLVTVNAVRPAELEHYFHRFEPEARLRRRLASFTRPQHAVVQAIERRLFRPPFPFCLPETKAIAADLQRHYGVPDDAIEVLSVGVDARRFAHDPEVRARVRARLGTPPERLVVLFTGDDFERKGLDRAVAALARSHTGAELWIAGGGPPDRYAELAGSLDLRDRVRFLGRVPHEEIGELYAGSDVFLLPSRQDAWGMPVLEALAAGRVVLASEFTGAHELIEHGANGFVLAGAGSPEQIAEILDGPAASPEERRRIGQRAVATAAEQDRDLLYERLRQAHHTAYERRLRRFRRTV